MPQSVNTAGLQWHRGQGWHIPRTVGASPPQLRLYRSCPCTPSRSATASRLALSEGASTSAVGGSAFHSCSTRARSSSKLSHCTSGGRRRQAVWNCAQSRRSPRQGLPQPLAWDVIGSTPWQPSFSSCHERATQRVPAVRAAGRRTPLAADPPLEPHPWLGRQWARRSPATVFGKHGGAQHRLPVRRSARGILGDKPIRTPSSLWITQQPAWQWEINQHCCRHITRSPA